MSQLEERAALENDLVWATGLCVSLVLIVVCSLGLYSVFRKHEWL